MLMVRRVQESRAATSRRWRGTHHLLRLLLLLLL
jgi:hypothetical protein